MGKQIQIPMDSAFFEGFFGGPWQVQKQAEALSPRSPRSSPRSPALSARVGVSQAADGAPNHKWWPLLGGKLGHFTIFYLHI